MALEFATIARFLLRTLAVAIAMFALRFIGHQLLLGRDYVSIEPIMRGKQQMQAYMPFALISRLSVSGAMVWIYSQGRTSKPWPSEACQTRLCRPCSIGRCVMQSSKRAELPLREYTAEGVSSNLHLDSRCCGLTG